MLLLADGVAAQASGTEQNWVSLGPAGVKWVDQIAVSPDWPNDPFLYVVANGFPEVQQPMRSFDGGATWEQLPSGPDLIRQLSVGPGRVIFARTCDSQAVTCRLLRSGDAGQTWQQVLDLSGGNVAMSTDGAAFVASGSQFLRSLDLGQTWQTLTASPGRQVHQVKLSPAYAQDRTIFLSTTVGQFDTGTSSGGQRELEAAISGDADLLVSRDGGDTWSSSSLGLEIDGVPFRHVQELVISPSFAQDGVLFAFAWGAAPPGEQGSQARATAIRTALFRSRDRGASWEYVWEPASEPSLSNGMYPRGIGPRYRASIALSPKLSSNGVAILALNWWHAGRTTGCKVFRTSDTGQNWASIVPVRNAMGNGLEACSELSMAGSDGLTAVWLATYDQFDRTSKERIMSRDGGLTLDTVRPPMLTPEIYGGRWPPVTLAPDGTIFAGTQNIWMLRSGTSESR